MSCPAVGRNAQPKVDEPPVPSVLYGRCTTGSFRFGGPRFESLPPPCAPPRHSKFHNALSPVPPLTPRLNLEHPSWKPDTAFDGFGVYPWAALPSPLQL